MHRRTSAVLLALIVPVGLLGAPPATAAPAPGPSVVSTSTELRRMPERHDGPRPKPAPQALEQEAEASEASFARQEVTEPVAIAAVVMPVDAEPGEVFVRTVDDGVTGEWEPVEIDEASDPSDPTTSTVPVVVSGADAVEVATLDTEAPATLQVYASAVSTADARASDLAWDHPQILSRRAWQADESLRRYAYTRAKVTGAMIHHTAGTNDYTADQVPALLRSIQAYHVTGRGWNDIAYNVLVDRFGRAWEGRGGGVNAPIQGGHALGVTNARTFGISLMGNFELVRPPAVMLETMNQVIAWKLQMHGIDPYGQTYGSGGQDGGSTFLNAISGHRDENATSCPGQYVYAEFANIRTRVKTLMDTVRYPRFRDVPVGTQFDQEIRWLADRGVSTGWDDGTFRPVEPISREAMAAFLYRLSGSPAFTAPEAARFPDVQPGHQFYKEISWLAATGITTGWDDGTFRPGAAITRDAMAAYLHRLYGAPVLRAAAEADVHPFGDVAADTQFASEIEWLAGTGISTGWALADGAEYRPVAPVNRDAMAAFMSRAVNQFGDPRPAIKPAEPVDPAAPAA